MFYSNIDYIYFLPRTIDVGKSLISVLKNTSIPLSNPSIYSKHVHMKYLQETE